MKHLDEQSVRDLGFDTIREWLADLAVQPTARAGFHNLLPLPDRSSVQAALEILGEWIMLRRGGAALPAIDFEELHAELAVLEVKEGVLPETGFERIWRASRLVNELIYAVEPIGSGFPEIYSLISTATKTDAIVLAISDVFDVKWRVKDEASPELREIRGRIGEVRRQIGKNFQKVMKECATKGFLADTGEAYLNDRRVLAVYSTHKRKVSGIVVGSSNTGTLTYIEPEVNIQLNFELEALYDDERNEIRKILRKLTRDLRDYRELISAYQEILTRLDDIQARGRLADSFDATIPMLSDEPVIKLSKAYHPILWMTNRKGGRTTFPQDIHMDKFSRMLVISGPNAGGKSITLKTIGLLQVMVQSGLAIPVAEGAELGLFDAVLTDIGDNQSIENQLSTYSYRLRRMKQFLDTANRRSLVLLDEFGTGSDPDLGGALAEVFFEELYNRKCFGVITTHYGNIKLLAARLRNAVNGCMLFNTETLEPLYRLSLGQPGSSFTFEVAEMNGIPGTLITEAKKRLSVQKVMMDQLLSELQSEKTRFESLSDDARKAGEVASKTIDDFERKREKYEEKLARQSDLIERNNKFLLLGKKMASFIEAWNLKARNKEQLEEVKKYIVIEKTRIEEERKVRTIRKKVQKEKDEKKEIIRHRELIQVGSLVRLSGTKQTGNVLAIDEEEATVAFGVFRTRVDIGRLEFIKGDR